MTEKIQLHLGTVSKKPYYYPLSQLTKHFIALGASGSGKTVLSKILIEECALQKVPSIVVDVQGDLSALVLRGDEEEVIAHGLSKEQYDKFSESTEITIFTPLSSKGIPICINPLDFSAGDIAQEDIIPVLNAVATALTKLLGYSITHDKGKFAEAVIYTLIKYSHDTKQKLETFSDLIALIKQPPEVLVSELAALIKDEKELDVLARKLAFLTIGEKKLLFQFGVPSNIDLLLGKKNKTRKTSISIIYMNTLPNQDEKEFFLATLTTQIYQWMLANPSDTLQCTYMIDEIAPFLPASSEKPLPKPALKILFKQARKYGVGCIIATQNPGDIDYKAFAQFGTWAVGRLSLKQDIKKVEQALKSISHKMDIYKKLPKLKPGHFLLFSPDINNRLLQLQARWLYSKHTTMNEQSIKVEMEAKQKDYKKYLVKPKKEIKINEQQAVENSKLDEVASKVVEFEEEKKLKTEKNHELFFESITFAQAMKIAKRKRKQHFKLFGQSKEELINVTKQYYPYVLTRVKVKEHFAFGALKTNKLYNVFFDGMTGKIIKANHKHHKTYEHSNLAELKDHQINILRKLLDQKDGLSVNILSQETKLSKGTVTKYCNELEKQNYVSYKKIETHKQWYLTSCFEQKHIFRVATKQPRIVSKTYKHKKIETKITEKQIRTFIKEWFASSTVVEYKIVLLPEFVAKYSFRRSTRTIRINGATKQQD